MLDAFWKLAWFFCWLYSHFYLSWNLCKVMHGYLGCLLANCHKWVSQACMLFVSSSRLLPCMGVQFLDIFFNSLSFVATLLSYWSWSWDLKNQSQLYGLNIKIWYHLYFIECNFVISLFDLVMTLQSFWMMWVSLGKLEKPQ